MDRFNSFFIFVDVVCVRFILNFNGGVVINSTLVYLLCSKLLDVDYGRDRTNIILGSVVGL